MGWPAMIYEHIKKHYTTPGERSQRMKELALATHTIKIPIFRHLKPHRVHSANPPHDMTELIQSCRWYNSSSSSTWCIWANNDRYPSLKHCYKTFREKNKAMRSHHLFLFTEKNIKVLPYSLLIFNLMLWPIPVKWLIYIKGINKHWGKIYTIL